MRGLYCSISIVVSESYRTVLYEGLFPSLQNDRAKEGVQDGRHTLCVGTAVIIVLYVYLI